MPLRRVIARVGAGVVLLAAPAPALAAEVRSGLLAARIGSGERWSLALTSDGTVVLGEHPNIGAGRTGRLGYVAGGRWSRATRIVRARRTASGGWSGVLATTDPLGGRLVVNVNGDGAGAVYLRASVLRRRPADVRLFGIAFAARAGERFLGFGERSNAVNQRGRTIENRVEEGPFLAEDYRAVAPTLPAWGYRRFADSSYFPMPWLLSTRGYGVLVGNPESSRFRLGSDRRRAWSLEVAAPRLRLSFLAGPTPAEVVRRMTARVGRQPTPAAPWFLGPWFQTGHSNEEPDERAHVRAMRDADAPVSAVETHMRYMPCGADVGREESERARTAFFHDQGLAALTYMREAVCATYEPVWSQGVAAGAFIRRTSGSTYSFPAFVGSGVTELAMVDFTTGIGRGLHATLLGRGLANGYDGWMEDYGEYVPPDAMSVTRIPGHRLHNLYPVLYHGSAHRFARRQDRPVGRFVRSGWTGVHRSAPIVWGGDPSTSWGFDGLRSSLYQGLTMGLSGIGIWGSDVGGFFTLTGPRLTRELLHRWIQFGAVSPVMRTKAQGIVTPLAERPQIWDPETLPLWRRYAKLHTQLHPYMSGAVADYRRTGMPLMRHLSLAYPRDRRALARDDEFLFGPDLLAAPLLAGRPLGRPVALRPVRRGERRPRPDPASSPSRPAHRPPAGAAQRAPAPGPEGRRAAAPPSRGGHARPLRRRRGGPPGRPSRPSRPAGLPGRALGRPPRRGGALAFRGLRGSLEARAAWRRSAPLPPPGRASRPPGPGHSPERAGPPTWGLES